MTTTIKPRCRPCRQQDCSPTFEPKNRFNVSTCCPLVISVVVFLLCNMHPAAAFAGSCAVPAFAVGGSVRMPWCRPHQFDPTTSRCSASIRTTSTTVFAEGGKEGSDEDDDWEGVNQDGVDLAAEFFQTVKGKSIDLEGMDDDDDDEEDDDDEAEGQTATPPPKTKETVSRQEEEEDEDDDDDKADSIPQSKVNLFKGRDEGGVGKLAGNVTFTNRELYSSLKDRVLESPAAFAKIVGDDEDAEEMEAEQQKKPYKPPELIPDSGLTAGEVVELVLDALNHNDIPTDNYGVEVLFAYSSEASLLKSKGDKAPTVEEYAEFIQTSEYAPMLDHTQVIIDKAEYSFDKKKAFYNVRLRTGTTGRDYTAVNFILSTKGSDDDDCWLIDSAIIRTEGLGRGRRRL